MIKVLAFFFIIKLNYLKSIIIVALMLIILRLIISCIIIIECLNYWISFLLIITFIRGIIILFIYIISLVEKPIIKKNPPKIKTLVLMLIFTLHTIKNWKFTTETNLLIYYLYNFLPIIITMVISSLILIPSKTINNQLKRMKSS